MSVAYDFSVIDTCADGVGDGAAGRALSAPPLRLVPARPEPGVERVRSASVTVLHAPVEMSRPVGLKLTARGRLVLALAVVALGVAFVWLAAASARPAPAARPVPATVTVRPGDTLWQIASSAAPQSDPAALVDRIERLNHLSSVDLVPGQVLRLR